MNKSILITEKNKFVNFVEALNSLKDIRLDGLVF